MKICKLVSRQVLRKRPGRAQSPLGVYWWGGDTPPGLSASTPRPFISVLIPQFSMSELLRRNIPGTTAHWVKLWTLTGWKWTDHHAHVDTSPPGHWSANGYSSFNTNDLERIFSLNIMKEEMHLSQFEWRLLAAALLVNVNPVFSYTSQIKNGTFETST